MAEIILTNYFESQRKETFRHIHQEQLLHDRRRKSGANVCTGGGGGGGGGGG